MLLLLPLHLPRACLLSFFQRSGLPKEVLAKVWDLANSQRAGDLGAGGAAACCWHSAAM